METFELFKQTMQSPNLLEEAAHFRQIASSIKSSSIVIALLSI